MSICEFCKEKYKVTFVCPHCGEKYCKNHRKPGDHNCPGIDTNFENKNDQIESSHDSDNFDEDYVESDEYDRIETVYDPVIMAESEPNELVEISTEASNEIEIEEKEPESETFNERISESGTISEDLHNFLSLLDDNKLLFIGIIVISISVGIFMGLIINPSGETDNIEQRYEALYEYYTELQSKNQNLTIQIEEQRQTIDALTEVMADLNSELMMLQNEIDGIFNNYPSYTYPTLAQLEKWLQEDETDTYTLNKDYMAVDQALALSIKGKVMGWKLGVVTIYGVSGTQNVSYTYCYTEIEPELFVYIDPQEDIVWWSNYYELITPENTWDLSTNVDVYVTEVDNILG